MTNHDSKALETSINFAKKLSYQRQYNGLENLKIDSILRQFESDRGRIINSAAIRRLQQKTQVFPLERNAAVRSRLTHSLEVQQVGRYIAKEIISKLRQQNKLERYHLAGLESGLESLVEMACLMHDIGNPPFGHFGEAAINNWFTQRLALPAKPGQDTCVYSVMRFEENDDLGNQLKAKLRLDLMQFEGNAQAIRLVHTLQRLNLTYAQIGSILKYTRPAYLPKNQVPEKYNYLMKKPGFYFSEEAFVETLRQDLGLNESQRYVLTYIMEAADDISYCLADLEDAVEKSIFSVEQLFHHLKQAWRESTAHLNAQQQEQQTSDLKYTDKDLFELVVQKSMDNYQKRRRRDSAQFFMNLRVETMKYLVAHASDQFIKFLPELYRGDFNGALLENGTQESCLLSIFKKVAFNYVFSQPEVEELELQGYRVISGLLDIYSPLLAMPTEDFLELIRTNHHKKYLIETRLLHKLSSKHCSAYLEAIDNLDKRSSEDVTAYKEAYEFYYRARLIQDYISGMTDLYAYDEYRHLMVAS